MMTENYTLENLTSINLLLYVGNFLHEPCDLHMRVQYEVAKCFNYYHWKTCDYDFVILLLKFHP